MPQLKKVTDDVAERFNFNTAISSVMELVNAMHAYRDTTKTPHAALMRETIEALLRLLAPFAPHITEELWNQTGHEASVHAQPWPKWDASALKNGLQWKLLFKSMAKYGKNLRFRQSLRVMPCNSWCYLRSGFRS